MKYLWYDQDDTQSIEKSIGGAVNMKQNKKGKSKKEDMSQDQQLPIHVDLLAQPYLYSMAEAVEGIDFVPSMTYLLHLCFLFSQHLYRFLLFVLQVSFIFMVSFKVVHMHTKNRLLDRQSMYVAAYYRLFYVALFLML